MGSIRSTYQRFFEKVKLQDLTKLIKTMKSGELKYQDYKYGFTTILKILAPVKDSEDTIKFISKIKNEPNGRTRLKLLID